jgi:penicillin amidase
VVGATLPGTPLMAIGSNGFVAWGLTNSWGDWSDLVVLEPAGTDGYRIPGGAREVERAEERIRVHRGRDEVVTVETTVWGPLVGEDLEGRRLALRWVAHDPDAVDIGFHRIEEARSAGEALDVAVRSGGPQLCVTVADAGGHIGWTLTGRIPRRRGHDGRVPASWADGSRGWSGWLWPEEVPRVFDPPAGFLWTANNRLVDGPALARLGDGGYFLGARARQIRDRLSRIERADEAAMLAVQLDDRALFLERWRGLLLALLDEEALRDRPLRRRARELVVDWGGRASVDSVGFRLVRGFRELVRQSVLDGLTEPVRTVRPDFTPDWIHQAEGALWQLVGERPPHLLPAGADSWRALLLSRFDDLLGRLVADGGDLAEQTWGRSNRVEVRHPLSRFVPALGRWLDMPAISLPGAEDMPRIQTPRQGASQRMVVAPGREDRGMFHMPGGQSGHPLSAHYDDLQAAWAAGSHRPLLPGAPRATLVARPPAEKRGEPR